MSGRPIKCVVVGDGTGKGRPQNTEFTTENKLHCKIHFMMIIF